MRYRNPEKEQIVIRTAIQMIVRGGINDFSMNGLARACHISVATLYIYYSDKEDLLRKIGVVVGKRFFDRTLEGFSADMSFADGLRKQWENRAAFSLDYPDEVAFFEIIRNTPYGAHVVEQSDTRFSDAMKQFSQNAVARGELIPLPLEVFWSVAYGPLYSLIRFHREGKSLAGKPFAFTPEIMQHALELVLKSLTP